MVLLGTLGFSPILGLELASPPLTLTCDPQILYADLFKESELGRVVLADSLGFIVLSWYEKLFLFLSSPKNIYKPAVYSNISWLACGLVLPGT